MVSAEVMSMTLAEAPNIPSADAIEMEICDAGTNGLITTAL